MRSLMENLSKQHHSATPSFLTRTRVGTYNSNPSLHPLPLLSRENPLYTQVPFQPLFQPVIALLSGSSKHVSNSECATSEV